MATQILTIKLKRNGWPDDGELQMMDESLLAYTTGLLDNENENTVWHEWRLEEKIVKREVHIRLKKNVAADGIAAMLT